MTILFKEDWLKPENAGAIIDTQTKNKSFIRFAALLKSMGCDNNSFCLALHNPALQGIDPYDPNLTLEQMAMITLECKNNFWYFIRTAIRVPGSAVDDPIAFNANRGNIALYWLFFNHITTILIQIRQTGKSFSSDVLMTYLLNIACTDTTINLLTKDDTLRSANLERLRDIERELPFFLKMRKKGDIGNTEEIHVNRLRNKYKGHLPNKSPKMALNVGRGMTSPIIQCDETAFFYNIAISLPAALAACTAARQLAKRKGQPYGIILTTTAGKKDDRDGRYVYNMVQEAATWTEKFFDCENTHELETLIRKSSKTDDLLVNCTFNHRQLGYTDEWLKDAVRTARAVGEDAERDFGNVWTSGSRSSPLPVAISDIIRASEVSDHYAQICSPGAYVLRWYIAEEDIPSRMSSDYCTLAMDSSDGSGGDDIGLVLRSIKTGEVLAAADINETNLITFCEWLCNLLEAFENVLFIPERRSTGAMIIDYLLIMLPQRNIDPFKRIYNKVVQEKDEYPDRYSLINKPMYARDRNIYVDLKKYFGFATSATGATSRTDLYSNTLINAAKMTGDKVKDPKLINQILGLVVRNGRVDHEEGGRDDLCISWTLSFWPLINGKHLAFYGINSRDILVNNKASQELNDPIALYENKYQERLREHIKQLMKEIEHESDEYVSRRLEAQLIHYSKQLTDNDRAILSVDELLTKAREHRQQRYRYN